MPKRTLQRLNCLDIAGILGYILLHFVIRTCSRAGTTAHWDLFYLEFSANIRYNICMRLEARGLTRPITLEDWIRYCLFALCVQYGGQIVFKMSRTMDW